MKLLTPILLVCGLASAQPAFEVASVRPSNPTPGPNDRRASTLHDRFSATGFILVNLMTIAYQVKDYQIKGGPAWIRSERYDIKAKSSGEMIKEESRAMLRTLIEDRFKLKVRHEKRELPVYVLIPAKDGPKLKPSLELLPGFQAEYRWVLPHLDMDALALRLTRELDRVVVDRTGLSGFYSITLEWSSEGPSIFTAIQEQLGLKLVARNEPIEFLIVESAEKPTVDGASLTMPHRVGLTQGADNSIAWEFFPIVSDPSAP